ncbi:conserved hypothetical protein [Roseibium sp. TrichSKD4]|uniref:DUF1761 domain-containing protein n=1 Tax=Roseibium sp. TrichSKD4 TaxID=744980 RepID=UPI0001E570CD|nr:DUF1761 domain-containing protein [Roseibium sp. TrichSKD4]EFO32317.1 conserved hypothetical protein [Roseibium sp. TrichSKD4]
MMFDGINLLGALFGAIASTLFGALWYTIFSKAWMRAASLGPDDAQPSAFTMVLTFSCQFLMAFILAGVIYHTGGTSIHSGLISATLVWAGFILATQVVNYRFQKRPWSLTIIDSGHWFGVLLIQGVVIGAVGSWPTVQ